MLTCCCCWLNTTIFSSIVLFYCVRFSLLKQSVRVSFIQMMPPRRGGSCSRGACMRLRFENRKIKKRGNKSSVSHFFLLVPKKYTLWTKTKRVQNAFCEHETGWNSLIFIFFTLENKRQTKWKRRRIKKMSRFGLNSWRCLCCLVNSFENISNSFLQLLVSFAVVTLPFCRYFPAVSSVAGCVDN